MSTPYPPPPPPRQIHVQQPVTDQSKRFLNLSAGALIAVITGLVLLCCIGPIAFCFFSPVIAEIGDLDRGNKAAPELSITSCSIDNSSPGSATVGLRLTNKGKTTESYQVKVEIRDSSGARVGSGSEYVSSLAPGSSATEEAFIVLSGSGGKTCHVTGVS